MDQALLSGLAVGSTYVLMTLGFALALAIADIMNAAHGAFVVGGMYVVLLLTDFGVHPIPAVLLAVVALGAASYLVYRLLLASAKTELGHGTQLVYTLLLLSGLTVLYQFLFGADVRTVDADFGNVHLLGGTLTIPQAVAIVVALVVGLMLFAAVRYTYVGKIGYVAGAYPLGAESIGVPIKRVYAAVFVLSGALAGLAGGLIVTFQPVSPTLGLGFLVVAILVALAAKLGIVMTVVLGFAYGVFQSALNYSAPATVAAVLPLAGFFILIILQRQVPSGWVRALMSNRERVSA